MKLKQRDGSPEIQARNLLKPGMMLYGYCGGDFGRDSYGDKKIIAVYEDHLVVEEEGHTLVSRTIHSWIKLIEDSNYYLEGQEDHENGDE